MSTYVEWKDFYNVGHAAIDRQHRQVIEMLNDLYAAMDDGCEGRAIRPVLDKLLQYTRRHFQDEERILQSHHVPDFEEHKALHDQMALRTQQLCRDFSRVTGRDLMQFLKNWWFSHIQDRDKRYAPYLRPGAAAAHR